MVSHEIQDGSLRRMAELHILEARRHALELFSLTSTIYPSEWMGIVGERVVLVASDFSAHATRVKDICELRDKGYFGADACRFKIDNSEINFEPNYIYALNKIRHARSLVLGWANWDGSNIFLGSNGQVVPSYVRVKTDNYCGNVSLFGLSFTFLTSVFSDIKQKYPYYNI